MNTSQPNLDTGAEGDGGSPPIPSGFLAPALGPDEIGRLAHYRVLKVLGQGGMGIVFLAEDTQLQREVALKVMRPEVGQTALNRQRFVREARAMAQVRSDHVVTIYQVGELGDLCYLAMELLEGEPLDQWLDQVGRSPIGEAVRIGREIALALAAAHARGLVHRDVKPANAWLEGPARRVKLLDFGLARPQEQDVHLTKTGMVLGTPLFMAPEQALGEALDGRADLFSLGCVLYLMVTGRPPFQGKTVMAVMTAVLTQTPLAAEECNPATPKSLNDLLVRLLAKEPANRPASADIVAEELRVIERALLNPSDSPEPRVLRPPQDVSPTEMDLSRILPPRLAETLNLAEQAARGSRSSDTPAQSHIREVERRQVTVMVCGCGIFESEAYLDLETEDQAQALWSFQQLCDQAVRSFDGRVVQCNEQGLVACFGYPIAYEDAARRGARAGLELLDEIKALGKKLHLEMAPWVGLHTGPAIVGVKEDAVSLVGDARNVAVRLKDVAATGKVICTESTHKLFQGRFQCTDLGPKTIAGVARLVALYHVEGTAVADSLFETSSPAGLTPLTGRDHEISLLKDRWEQAREGMGQVVFLVGEPGLGKSRLVHSLKEHVLGQTGEGAVDAPVIEWHGSPHYENTGLYPVIVFYERALGFRHDDSPQARFECLLKVMEHYGFAQPESVSLWAALLSLPTPDRFPPLTMPPARQREEIFRMLLEWLRMRTARGPVLFVVEDLHWIDASTLEFLGLLLAEFQHDRILILLTSRPEFQPPWTAAGHQTSLSLNRLTRRQVGDLMRMKSGDALPETVIDKVFERVGGVPLFVEEFTKMVQESDAPSLTMLGREIPSTLQDLVMARLDRMEGGRDVAQLAAVLGREFSHELLAAVAAMDEPTLQADLTKLARAEILYSKGRPPRCTHVFKHALLEDALYNSLVKGKRQQLHRRIGEVLEAQFPQTVETKPELLGHHFTEAGQTEKAADYWFKAGLRSKERSEHSEAVAHLTKGLDLVSTLEESLERDNTELRFLTTLGPAYIAARGYAAPEVEPILLRARELCRRIGDSQQQFGIMLGIWEWHIVRGDLRVCVGLAEDGLELANNSNDPGMLMEALFMSGVTKFYRGEFAGACAYCETAITGYEDRERTKFWTAYTGHDAGVTHRCYRAQALWHLGYPDQALEAAREMRELARSIGHAFSLGHALDFAAFLNYYCRLGAEVQATADEEMAVSIEQGFPFWLALSTLHKGAGLLLQGRREESLPVLLKGLTAFRASGAELRAPAYHGMLGEAYMQLGRYEEARKAFDEALSVAEKNDDRCHEAELNRLQGELMLAESPDKAAAAEGFFRQAIEIARRQQSKGWELRATMSLARLCQRQGRSNEAHVALQAVYGAYTEGFTMPDLAEAKQLLESLAG